MNCKYCGANVEAGQMVCNSCGRFIEDEVKDKENRQHNQQPYYQQPNYQQPNYQQPNYQQPNYQQPNYQQPYYQQPGTYADDAPSTGLNILAFFIPIVGLVLYLTNKDKKPIMAKSVGTAALIGFCVRFVLGFINGIIQAL